MRCQEIVTSDQGQAREGLVSTLAPVVSCQNVNGHDHFVQFYESDDFLVESISTFIGGGLGAGEAGIVIGTAEHRHALE